MSVLWNLFSTFFKIGLFAFGGGYAMIPLLQAELVDKRGWIDNNEIMDYYSISQCTPGVISVNVATFIGYKLKKVIGAVCATVGIVLPSLLIIMGLANILTQYASNQYVSHAFAGIRIVVIALILDVIWGMRKDGIGSLLQGAVFALSLLALLWFHASTVSVVLVAAFVGFMVRE